MRCAHYISDASSVSTNFSGVTNTSTSNDITMYECVWESIDTEVALTSCFFIVFWISLHVDVENENVVILDSCFGLKTRDSYSDHDDGVWRGFTATLTVRRIRVGSMLFLIDKINSRFSTCFIYLFFLFIYLKYIYTFN